MLSALLRGVTAPAALLANAAKGGIAPAAPRPTTPEQDEVLAFMHKAITEHSPAG